MRGLRIEAGARPVHAAAGVADVDRAEQRTRSGRAGGTNGDCSQRNFFRFSSACARSAGVKSIRSFSLTKVREYGGGLVGMRLRRRGLLRRHVGLRHRLLGDRPDRLAGDAVEHVEPALLGRLRDQLARLAVDRRVDQQRRRRVVVVPQADGGPAGSATCARRSSGPRATRLSANRLLPGRLPPYSSMVGVSTGR